MTQVQARRLADSYHNFLASTEGGDDYAICVWGERLYDAQLATGVVMVPNVSALWTDALLRELER